MSLNPELLHDVRHETMELLRELRGVYEDAHRLSLPLPNPIDQYLNVFRNEELQVEDLTMTVAVIGTMKAGKSTLLNAIVGDELLPSRELGMTAMPTMIHRKGDISEPELEIPVPGPFRQVAAHMRDKISSKGRKSLDRILSNVGEKDSSVVREELLGEMMYSFPERVVGKQEIRKCLSLMNDLIRLSQQRDVKIPSPTDGLTSYRDFPQLQAPVSVDFEPRVDPGKLVFVDTPGQNEAGAMNLGPVVRQQLQNASAVILVLNYEQLNEKEAAVLQGQVMFEVREYSDRLHVVVNRFDAEDTRSMDAEQVKRFVANNLLEDIALPEERVYPISARDALWAMRAIGYLEKDGQLPDQDYVPWVKDFGRVFLGKDWEEEIGDVQRVQRCAHRGLRDSRFADLRSKVIEHAFSNAASGTFESAFSKVSKYAGANSDLNDVISIKLVTAEESLEKAVATADQLKYLLEQIPKVQSQAQSAHDRVVRNFETTVSTEKDRLLQEVKLSHWATEGEVETAERSTSFLSKDLSELWNDAKQAFIELKPQDYDSESEAKIAAEDGGSKAYQKVLSFWKACCEKFAGVIDNTAQKSLESLAEDIDRRVDPFREILLAIGEDYGKDEVILELSLPEFPRTISGLDDGEFAQKTVEEKRSERRELRPRSVFGWTLPDFLPNWPIFKETVIITTTKYRFDASVLEKWCDEKIERWVNDQLRDFRRDLEHTLAVYLKGIQCKLQTWKEAFEDRKRNEELDADQLTQFRQGLKALNDCRRALLKHKEELRRGLQE